MSRSHRDEHAHAQSQVHERNHGRFALRGNLIHPEYPKASKSKNQQPENPKSRRLGSRHEGEDNDRDAKSASDQERHRAPAFGETDDAADDIDRTVNNEQLL